MEMIEDYDYVGSTLKALKRHQKKTRKHGDISGAEQLERPECPRGFLTEDNLVRHLKDIHKARTVCIKLLHVLMIH